MRSLDNPTKFFTGTIFHQIGSSPITFSSPYWDITFTQDASGGVLITNNETIGVSYVFGGPRGMTGILNDASYNDIIDDISDISQNLADISGNYVQLNPPTTNSQVINSSLTVLDISGRDASFNDISANNFYSLSGSSFFGNLHGNLSGNMLEGNVTATDISAVDISANNLFIMPGIQGEGSVRILIEDNKNAIGTNTTNNTGSVTIHSDVTNAGSGSIITTNERTAIGTNTTNNTGTVTIHSDVDDAGSGSIITTNERTAIGTNTTNNTGSVTIHSDVTNAGSGSIITTSERNAIGTNTSNIQDISNNYIQKNPPTTAVQTINSDLSVTGNFTVNGTPTQINSENLDISDNVIVLNAGLNSTTNPNDTGILINRGAHDPSKNAFMGWNEPIGEFTMGITEASGNSIGDINLTGGLGNLRANIIGNNLYIDASNNGNISANDASFNDLSGARLYALNMPVSYLTQDVGQAFNTQNLINTLQGRSNNSITK